MAKADLVTMHIQMRKQGISEEETRKNSGMTDAEVSAAIGREINFSEVTEEKVIIHKSIPEEEERLPKVIKRQFRLAPYPMNLCILIGKFPDIISELQNLTKIEEIIDLVDDLKMGLNSDSGFYIKNNTYYFYITTNRYHKIFKGELLVTFAHEVYHVVNNIRTQFRLDGHEDCAYLSGYIFEQCLDLIQEYFFMDKKELQELNNKLEK